MRFYFSAALFLVALSINAQQLNWVAHGGGHLEDWCRDIATDSQGDVYWIGEAQGIEGGETTVDFGCDVITTAGALGTGFLAKHDNNGQCLWIMNIIAPNVNHIAIDSQDHVYVVGSYRGMANFGNEITLIGSPTADAWFTARYDASGTCVWARTIIGTGAYSDASSLALDPEGGVYVGGRVIGPSITVDSLALNTGSSDLQMVIVKYDSLGTAQWARSALGSSGKTVRDISIAKDRLFITGGLTSGGASYDGLSLTSDTLAYNKMYVLACDLDGNGLWAEDFDGTADGTAESYAISADTLGNVFIAGAFTHSLVLPDQVLSMSWTWGENILLLCLDHEGSYRWGKGAGSSGRDRAWDIVADGMGNAYVAASFEEDMDFFGAPLSNMGHEHALIAKLDSDGLVIWFSQPSSTGEDVARTIHRQTVSPYSLYFGGIYFGPVTYGTSTIDDIAHGDAMIVSVLDTTIVDIVTALPQCAPTQDFLLFPSPAADYITIRTLRPVTQLWVVTMLGDIIPLSYDGTGRIDVQGLASGFYFLRAVLNDGSVSGKAFVKD